MEPYGFLGAVLRHERALHHRREVERLVAAFRDERRDIGDLIETLWEGINVADLRTVEIPESIGIIAGEVIYNLRAALDYLVFALAWHDTGRRPAGAWERGLQFPIERDGTRFERAAKWRLNGLSERHVHLVASFQPFAGCQWTAELAELSNADKHRHLLALVGKTDLRTWESRSQPSEEAEPDEEGLYDFADLDFETLGNFDVVLPSGEPITTVVTRLTDESWQLLHRFAKEFKLHPVPVEDGWQ